MKFLRYLCALLLAVVIFSAGAFFYFKHQFSSVSVVKQNTSIMVSPGEGGSSIANELYRNGLIAEPWVFKVAILVTGNSSKLRSGEYAIPAGATQEKILNILLFDKPVFYKITLPEGALSEEIRQKIVAEDKLKGDLPAEIPEGLFKPETYVFARGTERSAILKQMQDAQKKILAELWEKRAPNLPLKTPEEALVLASIVEKETGTDGERAKVASVFINRLRKGYKLQSDPTIIYGITGGQGKLNRPIYRTDILRKTDFNTYVIDALPPGPICNPGEAALRATLQPDETEYLYFVADGTGGHAFSKTLQEHNRNVVNWRKIERNQAKKSKN